MCTVTYIPNGSGNYILTSNRDEAPERSPQQLTTEKRFDQQLTFPRDTAAGGTWIAVSNTDRLVCLLNGAFERHARLPEYRRSRGLMVLDFFGHSDADDFFREYEFTGMEPFTMIICEKGQLMECRWDGEKRHVRLFDPNGRYIWSSATLYDREIQLKREQWFESWQKNQHDFNRQSILDFHQTAGDGDPRNDIIMTRERVRTVSISSVVRTNGEIDLLYLDLLREQARQSKIRFKGEVVVSR
ncbi:MAG TPA: NRDE family protein [Saprospiraceae bacterium]|nr:NRDE family protein [Saprospiraceae bacterium]HMQ83437.1 NRDE family protein [Saprospiraceae bacterium]